MTHTYRNGMKPDEGSGRSRTRGMAQALLPTAGMLQALQSAILQVQEEKRRERRHEAAIKKSSKTSSAIATDRHCHSLCHEAQHCNAVQFSTQRIGHGPNPNWPWGAYRKSNKARVLNGQFFWPAHFHLNNTFYFKTQNMRLGSKVDGS